MKAMVLLVAIALAGLLLSPARQRVMFDPETDGPIRIEKVARLYTFTPSNVDCVSGVSGCISKFGGGSYTTVTPTVSTNCTAAVASTASTPTLVMMPCTTAGAGFPALSSSPVRSPD